MRHCDWVQADSMWSYLFKFKSPDAGLEWRNLKAIYNHFGAVHGTSEPVSI